MSTKRPEAVQELFTPTFLAGNDRTWKKEGEDGIRSYIESLEATIREMGLRLLLQEGCASMLLSVQEDCIAANAEIATLKARLANEESVNEKYRLSFDAKDAEIARLKTELAQMSEWHDHAGNRAEKAEAREQEAFEAGVAYLREVGPAACDVERGVADYQKSREKK